MEPDYTNTNIKKEKKKATPSIGQNPLSGVLVKTFSEYMQEIYRRAPY